MEKSKKRKKQAHKICKNNEKDKLRTSGNSGGHFQDFSFKLLAIFMFVSKISDVWQLLLPLILLTYCLAMVLPTNECAQLTIYFR